ncbi:hypothetical protein [Streptomyces sp. NBC_01353]|uniref:hypothetical protein n=1 Tax=Streptomyces sp. NBC_01353 TaxID=2903835 RepID=UPI002E2FBB17|nr:hypothetical protein [Streptomyces sp. NBC_01353]
MSRPITVGVDDSGGNAAALDAARRRSGAARLRLAAGVRPATLQIQTLVDVHRPNPVVLELPNGAPSAATVSAVARAKRMCGSISIPLTLFNGAIEHLPESGYRLVPVH